MGVSLPFAAKVTIIDGTSTPISSSEDGLAIPGSSASVAKSPNAGSTIAERGDTSITGALRGLSFDHAHGFFQGQPLVRYFGFGKWRVYGAQLG